MLHALAVAHVRDDRHAGDIRGEPGQLVVRVEDRVLAVPQQDEPGRLEPRELAAELAADRAAGAGDQHRLAGRQLADLRQVGDDRLPPQQVLDLHLPERRDRDAARQDVEHPRHGARTGPCRMRGLHHLAHDLSGRARHRDDHFLRGKFVDEVGQVLE